MSPATLVQLAGAEPASFGFIDARYLRTSTPATRAPAVAKRRAISTTPRCHPPSPERKMTTERTGPSGRYMATDPYRGTSRRDSLIFTAAPSAGADAVPAAAPAAIQRPLRQISNRADRDGRFMRV